MRRRRLQPFLVAIVGGSGAGKTWLAEKLQAGLRPECARFSLDDFYRDRSHLPPGRRAKLNFDHPRAIDWEAFTKVLRACRAGRTALVPCYDFKTHSRLALGKLLRPKPIVLVDGLWLTHRPALRRGFDLRIYVEASITLRLRRRLSRDARGRGRTRASVREQFWRTVQPMHVRFVAPQARWADVVWKERDRRREFNALLAHLRLAARRSGRLEPIEFPGYRAKATK